MRNKKLVFAWSGLVITTLLIFAVTFLLYILSTFSQANLIAQIGLQRAISQRIAKDVLILSSQPSGDDRAQAISELQLMLPRFEEVQRGLREGNPGAGLPRRIPEHIAQELRSAQSDFAAILAATKMILAHADEPIDTTQVAIILAHERGYYLAMSNISSLWQHRIDEAYLHAFYIESGVLAGVLIVVFLQHFGLTLPALRSENNRKVLDSALNPKNPV